MRTALAHKSIEKYLQKCGTDRKFTFGLIIGQSTSQNKDYIIHLARNSECLEAEHDIERNETETDSHSTIKSLKELHETSLSHQAISLIKMVPGCFHVIGIFIVDDQDLFASPTIKEQIKVLVDDINRIFDENKYLCGNSGIIEENKMILFYNSKSKNTLCRYFEPKNKSNFSDVELVFLEKQIEWVLFETNYEMDEVFPIIEESKKLNIETHFDNTLIEQNTYLKNSKIFVKNEPIEDGIILENYLKKTQVKQEKGKKISLPVSIFSTIGSVNDSPTSIDEYNGLIKYSGIISSKIWANSKSSFEEIYNYIRTDIIRSMASRIQLYCDGLIDTKASKNDLIIVNEPPRRVFFEKLEGNGIQFCDYIFHGESTSVVSAQAKDILDLEIEPDAVNDMVEGHPEDDNVIGLSKNPTTNTKSKYKKDYGNLIIASIGTGIFVLIVAILLSFFLR